MLKSRKTVSALTRYGSRLNEKLALNGKTGTFKSRYRVRALAFVLQRVKGVSYPHF
jgi:hypothetical protein